MIVYDVYYADGIFVNRLNLYPFQSEEDAIDWAHWTYPMRAQRVEIRPREMQEGEQIYPISDADEIVEGFE